MWDRGDNEDEDGVGSGWKMLVFAIARGQEGDILGSVIL